MTDSPSNGLTASQADREMREVVRVQTDRLPGQAQIRAAFVQGGTAAAADYVASVLNDTQARPIGEPIMSPSAAGAPSFSAANAAINPEIAYTGGIEEVADLDRALRSVMAEDPTNIQAQLPRLKTLAIQAIKKIADLRKLGVSVEDHEIIRKLDEIAPVINQEGGQSILAMLFSGIFLLGAISTPKIYSMYGEEAVLMTGIAAVISGIISAVKFWKRAKSIQQVHEKIRGFARRLLPNGVIASGSQVETEPTAASTPAAPASAAPAAPAAPASAAPAASTPAAPASAAPAAPASAAPAASTPAAPASAAPTTTS